MLYLSVLIKSELIKCERDKPILISNDCQLKYCTEAEFDSKVCIINNQIIKTQWLNNIIPFGELSYRYINFATYENGDMILETNSFPPLSKRIFFGLKQSGRPYFISNDTYWNETLFYSQNVIDKENSDNIIGRFESETLIVKHNDTKKEYYLGVSKYECKVELFDFWNENNFYKTSREFTENKDIKSFRHSLFPLSNKSNNNEHYYIFSFVGSDSVEEKKLFIQKHIFKGDNWESESSLNKGIYESNGYGNTISCFESESQLIICFYMTLIDDNVFLNFVKYDINLENKIISDFQLNYIDEKIFFKSIHLKGEIGVFAYYEYYSDSIYPFLTFKEFNKTKNGFENYLNLPYYNSTVILKKYKFNTNLLLNDIIQLTEKKIAYCAVDENKEILYIILLNIFGYKKIKIRYYLIRIFDLNNYKILFDLRICGI